MCGYRAAVLAALTAAAALPLAGCGTIDSASIIPDRRADYRASQTGNSLEIPPDLTSSTIDDTLIVPDLNPTDSANLSDYSSERGDVAVAPANAAVLPQSADLRIRRAGQRRWLQTDQPPAALWPRVKSFWDDSGFELVRADPTIGIMETGWLENRADIPDGPIRGVLKRYLDFAYAAPTRDKFRVRLEPSDDASGSEIYLTHYGVEEVNTGSNPNDNILVWQPRQRDPELEAEMLNRLMVHLGADERRAALADSEDATPATPRTRLIDTEDGYRALVIDERYDRAWRLVGLALDGSRYAIEDQNRAEGLYLVGAAGAITRNPKDDDEGFFAWLFRPDDNAADDDGTRYRVRLAGRGEQTMVVVQNDQGQPDRSAAADDIIDSVRGVIR